MPRNENKTRHGRSVRTGVDFTSIRSLIGTGYRGNQLTVVSLPMSMRQITESVSYDRSSKAKGNASKAMTMNFEQIQGGIKVLLAIDAIVALVISLIVQAIKLAKVDVAFNADEAKAKLTAKINEVFGGRSELTLLTVLKAIRAVQFTRSYGDWAMPSSTVTTRFIASALCWAYGEEWVKANCTFVKKTNSNKPEGALAVYFYDSSILAQSGQPLSVAIPTCTPIAIAVIGLFPNGQGGYNRRFIGTMPNQAMVPDQLTGTPLFVRHDMGKPATDELVNAILLGDEKDASTMFQSADGGHFVFTSEVIAMSRRNPDGFVIMYASAIATTNGNTNVVKTLRTQRAALAAARSTILETLGRDYTSKAPASSTHRVANGTAGNIGGVFGNADTTEELLVPAGSSPSFGGGQY